MIGVHSVQFDKAVERLIGSRMVMLSNLDCLFQVTTFTDAPISGRGLWLYASAKYPNPQWYSKTLVLGLHSITR